MTFESFKSVWPRAYDLMLNIMIVYFLDYSCTTCFADRLALYNKQNTSEEHKEDYFVANYYICLHMSYRLGVFISKSSLSFLTIPDITILSVVQFFNFMAMLLNSFYKRSAVLTLWVLCPYFFWIGLIGGAAYVNVWHNFLKRESLRKDEKETAISFGLVGLDIGVTLASVFSMFMTAKILRSD